MKRKLKWFLNSPLPHLHPPFSVEKLLEGLKAGEIIESFIEWMKNRF